MNSDNINGLKDGANRISDDTQALLSATADVVDEQVVKARNRLSAALDAARQSYATVQKKAAEGAKVADKVIRENPYQAIGVAFGVGALVGFLLAKRGK